MTRRQRLLRWLKRLVVAALAVGVAGLGVALGTFWYFSRDLPDVDALHHWRGPQVTKVTCRGGPVCAEFFTERRTWVDVTTLPKHVRDAFLAAEDADFYAHHGLDWVGIARSAVKNLKPGGLKSGASTISQQTCRRLLLSTERTLARKVREWILTPRMEAALSKDEILSLYVNSIYFGHNRYGIEEASLFYFGKRAKDLSVGEAAVIAGTVQSPVRINPLTNVVRAKKRQRYVLEQLWKKGFVDRAAAEAFIEAPIVLGPRPPAPVGQGYAEEVRKLLVAQFGEKTVMEGGLAVDISMDPKLQAAAEAAVRKGLEAVDRRQGYRGPVGAVDLAHFTRLRPLLETRLAEAGKRRPDDVLVADLAVLKSLTPPAESEDPFAEPEDPVLLDEPIPSEDEQLARAVGVKVLSEAVETVGVVTRLDQATQTALVDLIGREAQLSFDALAWARRRSDAGALGPPPKGIADVVAPGDLVRVRLGRALPASTRLEATLAQVPRVQGALLALEPTRREVVAMVGGYDFATSAFNRATQARRQPGSSFKPFLYAAALESGRYTPITRVNDAPVQVRDPFTGKAWEPKNFEKAGFDGPITLRRALTLSKNTISARLVEDVTVDGLIAMARRAGIRAELPQSLTLCLGTGEVTMLEIANAYATLHSQGQFAEPVVLRRVAKRREGGGEQVLLERSAAFEPAIAPAVAFLTTSLMRSVVEEGTAVAVLELKRPAAGKTGTAQEYRDAWFTGFTQQYVASAWVGFDDHAPIGSLETGGRAALPLWLEFMKAAHQGLPALDFPVPEGVTAVKIDPVSGKLAGASVPGRQEYFLAGTEPTEEAPRPGTVDPNDFLLLDSQRSPR
ncbi:MAG: PBP1A family penicillin-binding protein [Myxococcaceae bacterium]|nr:PBP1A family penicillin-binding protein [Myxococcaceae bacterium]MCA3016913.1 PBP1A family penicillin-binding protein [Myxococcaceae bacterium]